MHNKIKFLFFILLVIFSLHAMSQTEEKSLHPKLDKYYTTPPAPTPNIVAPPVAQTKPVTETKPVADTKPLAETKPVVQAIPLPEEKPVVENPPSLETKPLFETQTLNAVSDSSSLNKPVNTVIAQPEQKKPEIQRAQKPTSVYMDTRLGSSSPLYDTYKTNSDGAGSVTTMPKR